MTVMPIELFSLDDVDYQIVTANKAVEPFYREELSSLVKEKYGNQIKRSDVLSVLEFAFDYYADRLKEEICKIDSVIFFTYVYFLHEQSTELAYLKQEGYNLPVDGGYFVMYRRALKIILQESCFLNLHPNDKKPNQKGLSNSVSIVEKLVYLAFCLISKREGLSMEMVMNGSIAITFENGLITFLQESNWSNFLPMLTRHFPIDGQNSIVDESLEKGFNDEIKSEIGVDLNDIEHLLHQINQDLQNREPAMICSLKEFIDFLKKKSQSPLIENFIRGFILNRQNATDIKLGVRSPYTGRRIIHKPILALTIDGEECILMERFSFQESMHTFFQNSITYGKIPLEWEQIDFFKKIRVKYKKLHKDILENPVEEELKRRNVQYDRNIKTLLGHKQKDNFSINKSPGEIDFIIIHKGKILIADCKNLTKRHEMHGYSQDFSKFVDEYNPKMIEKLEFLKENLYRLKEHMEVKLGITDFDISNFQVEGIFIINTPTLYALNGVFKTYTYHRFIKLLEGEDYFVNYVLWKDGKTDRRITWPYIDNFRMAIEQ